MPRPSQVRKQQAEKEGGHRSSCGLEPRGYRVVLHDWRRRPLIGQVVRSSRTLTLSLTLSLTLTLTLQVVLALLKGSARAVRAEVLAEEEDGRWRVRPLGEGACPALFNIPRGRRRAEPATARKPMTSVLFTLGRRVSDLRVGC